MSTPKIEDTIEAWENGELGCDPAHMKPAPPEAAQLVDAALGIITLPIRLPSELLSRLRIIAEMQDWHVEGLILNVLEDYADAALPLAEVAADGGEAT